MDKDKRKNSGAIWLVMTVVFLAGYILVSSDFVQDTWRGWQYDESVEVGLVRKEIELTDTGERIFLATSPALESAESFNEHCENQRVDVSLLGCYTDGRMYIYDVRSEELTDVKKVTAAHELLHAAWVRMNRREQENVTKMLEDFAQENEDWVNGELEFYNEDEKMEELYTRVATKVREVPDELEEHYRKYFANRLKIVEFYENYQAPFNELRQKCLDLKEKTDTLSAEISEERSEYERNFADLKSRVDEFNRCAETMGCFTSEEVFLARRKVLENDGVKLQQAREKLNTKIDDYNEMVMEYENYRLELGELSDSMNSKINKVNEGAI